MSAARVLHFGDDECHRLAVLRQAGYCPSICLSEPQLLQELHNDSLDAVLFPDLPGENLRLSELRTRTTIPFVLFGSPLDPALRLPFDLVIDPITAPAEWLQHLERTIQRARRLRENSVLLRSESQALRCDSESLRRDSEAVRQFTEAVREKLDHTRKTYPPPGK